MPTPVRSLCRAAGSINRGPYRFFALFFFDAFFGGAADLSMLGLLAITFLSACDC
jgi:hypothetical protein